MCVFTMAERMIRLRPARTERRREPAARGQVSERVATTKEQEMTLHRRPLSPAHLNRRVALGGAGAAAVGLSLGSRLGRAAAQEAPPIEKESDVPYGQPGAAGSD